MHSNRTSAHQQDEAGDDPAGNAREFHAGVPILVVVDTAAA
jgi:hypothetical protein